MAGTKSDQTPKTPTQSAVETRFLLMPNQANPYGTAFGGAIMSAIDMTASMAAQKHCQGTVVTAAIDSIIFEKPIHIGEQTVLQACVNYVGNTSMEVGVRVLGENPSTGQSFLATTAHLTFVAIDEKTNKPMSVPPLCPETEDEKRRYENAKIRVIARKELREKIKQQAQNRGQFLK